MIAVRVEETCGGFAEIKLPFLELWQCLANRQSYGTHRMSGIQDTL